MARVVMGNLRIKAIVVHDRGYKYRTILVEGKGKHGERIRKKFKTREEALAFKNEQEVEIANSDFRVQKIVSRLDIGAIKDAEMAVAKLDGKASLLTAAEFYLDNYREPKTKMLLSEAVAAFLEERTKTRSIFYIRPRTLKQCNSVWRQFRAYISTHHGGDIPVHKIERSMITGFLNRTENAKTYCNWHSELNQFHTFCLDHDREWVTGNPLLTIQRPRIPATGIPEVLPLQKVRDVMKYVAEFSGTSKRTPGKPGQLVPYFSLALFAGVRTDDDGELVKIAKAPDAFGGIIDLHRKVIRLPAHISKTGQPRPVKIRTSLAAWLTSFPGPILPSNHDKDIAHVRRKFEIGRDVMRHTWYSMHVIAFGSVGDAALEGGSTEAVVRKSYLNMAQHTREEALEFWDILPGKS